VTGGEVSDVIAELALRIERDGAGGHPDYPVVTILVDGRDVLSRHGRNGYKGFSPAEILGPDSPLFPQAAPRRVAVYRCCCGITGCGCVGWCQFGPPAEVATINNAKAYEKGLTELPDWRRRRRGLSGADPGAASAAWRLSAHRTGGVVRAIRLHAGPEDR
jgi:hypothetical protein